MYDQNRRVHALFIGFPNGNGSSDLLNAGFTPRFGLTEVLSVEIKGLISESTLWIWPISR